jgi:hypothetical protein
MAYNANELALFREQTVFVKAETTRGTLVFPAATDAIRITGDGINLPNQAPTYSDSPEISSTRGIMTRTPDMYPPGKWGFGTLVRPSGTAGTPPLENLLLKGLSGTYTNTPATSDLYQPIISGKPTFSLWWKVGHTVYFASYCTVREMGIAITNKGYPIYKWAGEFAKLGWVGKNTLSGDEAAGQTVLSVTNAKYFCVGGKIWNVTKDDDNTGAGYAITDRSISGNTITISPAVPAGGWSSADEIAGFLPTASVPTSYEAVNKNATIKFDSVAATIRTLDLTITDPLEFLSDEITVSGYPEDALESDRAIKGTLKLTFRSKELVRFYDAYNVDASNTLNIIFNDGVAGREVDIALAKAKLDVPVVNADKPAITLDIGLTGLESSGEDSYSITYS